MKDNKIPWLQLGLTLALLIIISILGGNQASAKPQASIDFVEPDGNLDFVAEGLDYATQIWYKPWTFSELSDLLHPSPYLSVNIENGMMKGQILGNDPYFFLLFPGLPGAVNLGTGQIHAIDPSKYEKVSFRLCTSATNPSQEVRFYWYSGFTNGPTFFSDRVQIQGGCHVYIYDLASHSDWQGQITGLRLDQDEFQVGDVFFLDWLRLVEKDNAPSFEIQWANLSPTGGTLTFHLDTDTTGHDGFEIGQIANASEQGSFHWGAADHGYPLPNDVVPGSYYVYAKIDDEWTNYGPEPITVSQAPLLEIVDPSFTSGPDYATVNGNPWDMDSSTDGEILGSNSYYFSGGEVEAWNTGNDPNFMFNVPTPIDTSFYRFFSIELYSNYSFYTSPGGMMRLYWLNSWDAYTVMQDIIINTPAAWRTYSMDLTQVPLESGGAQLPWNSNAWQILRLDPNENVNGVNWQWRIRHATLTGPPIADSFYHIKWEVNNPESELITTTWYYDTDNSSFDGTLIGSGRSENDSSHGMTAHQVNYTYLADHHIYLPLVARNSCSGDCLTWDSSSIPPGEYYIYGCVDDGSNQLCRYSDVPILVR